MKVVFSNDMLPNDVQVSQRFMSTLMLLPIFLLYCSLVFRVLESHYSISWVRNRWETATRKGQFMGVLFRKVSALQLPRTRVTGCEFQEKPEEVTKCAKSLLAMQTINLFNLHSPCSEPKRKKVPTSQPDSILDKGFHGRAALVGIFQIWQ